MQKEIRGITEEFHGPANDSGNNHIVSCSIGGGPFLELLIDSGAELNVLTTRDWETIESSQRDGIIALYDIDREPQLNVCSYASTASLHLTCTFKAWIKSNCETKPETFAEFAVVKGGSKSLLGRHTAMEMRLLAIGLQVNAVTNLTNEPEKFPTIPNLIIDFDIDETIPPIRHAYVNIPAHYKEVANDRLKAMEKSDIIERVTAAPRWISGMSAVPKGKGDFRLIVNMRGPNKAIQRQFHQMPRVEEMRVRLNGAKCFTKLDLHSAFHHVTISEKSRELTTFMAPSGMFRFKRLVFGVNCAPEIFQRIMERILEGITNVIVYIDDILIFAETKGELRVTTDEVLKALKRNNLTLNESKCVYEAEKLTFLGHELSADGLNIDKQKIKDVEKFREPKTFSELRSFLGLASYVSAFIPRFADITGPLWKVTSGETFEWGADQVSAFVKVKEAIINCTTAQGYFDVSQETFLYSDASPHALGAVLVQKSDQGVHRIISFASKSLTKTEKNYAQTQREALAVVWGTEHFFYYLLGHKFTIRTDAQGIAYIFNRNGDIPKRLIRRAEGWAMRLDAFDFQIEFVKGSENIADPSSRLYFGQDSAYDETKAPSEIAEISLVKPPRMDFGESHLPLLEVAFQTKKDKKLQALIEALETEEWGPGLEKFKSVREELHHSNGVIMRLGSAVIPEALQEKALKLAHAGHPGISKMKSILRERVWWPSMGKSTEKWVEACKTCVLNSRKEPPTPMQRTKLPEAPWDFLAADFCGPFGIFGGIYVLTLLDYFTRFMLAAVIKATDFESTEKVLSQIFDTYGFPGALKTDNGPPFNSAAYREYCENRGISPVFSWPLTPQQNGMAERAMQVVNKAMQSASVEGGDFRKALAEGVRAHNSAIHRVTNEVPSNLMFGRKIRRALPLASSAVYAPDIEAIRTRDAGEKERAQERENSKRGARDSRIMVGDRVVLRRAQKRKGETNYGPDELEVMKKREGDLTLLAADGKTVKRHITLTKKVSCPTTATTAASTGASTSRDRPKRIIKAPDRLTYFIQNAE